MLKKLNMLVLVMLIASQTILGPMASAGVVFAEAGNNEGNESNGEGHETTEEVVDKDDLEELLKDVAQLKAEDFSEKTFKALEEAVEKAEEVFENDDATQDEVDEAVEAVEDAEEDLDVDKVALTTLLDDNTEKAEEDYTADSFADFVKAVTAGEEVADKEDATQKEVNEVVTEIEKAIKALKEATEPDEDEGDADEGNKEEGTEPEKSDKEKGSDSEEEEKRITSFGMTTFSDDEEYEKEIKLDDSHIKGFIFKINGKEFTKGGTIEGVSNEDKFELKIDLIDPLEFEELNYGPGTKLKYPLPAGFSDHFTYLDNLGSFDRYGNVKIEGDYVVITLNENILIGGTPSDIHEGTFTIKGNFSDSNDKWDKEITMPGEEKFKVNFVPKDGKGVTIEKGNGTPYKDDTQTNQKSNKIEWKVTVNTNLANTSANPVFKDTLSSNATGHKYDTDSVEIREIDVRPNGDVTSRTEVNIEPSFGNDNTEMTINLEAGKAYEITYTTIPDNPETNEDVTYHNSANYNGTSDSGYTSVHFGKAIEKTVGQPGTDLITNWTIKYNGNEQLIKLGTTMSDSWTTELPQGSTQEAKQDLVGGADGISIGGFTEGTDYKVIYTDGNQGFEIKFLKDFSNPIEIKYKTKPVEGLKGSESFTVANKAIHGQIDTTTKETSRYNQTSLTLKKDATSGLDYNTKTMTWKITANQARYQMDAGTTFVDTFTNKNMVLDDNAEFKVTIGGQLATQGEQADYVLTNKGTEGFEVKLNASTDKEVVIEYTTIFDQIKNVDEDRSQNYHNRVVLTESGLPGNPQDTANINSNTQQKVNGSKSGSYNYEAKEFTWTIIFNYNSNTLTNAVLKDVLPAEHEITEVTLEKGSINSGGTFVADTDQDGVTQPDILGKHEFSHTLGQITQPYRLVYKTKMKDEVLPVDGNRNYLVKNKAQLLDGDTPNAEWESTVTVNHSNKVLDQKNGSQVDNSETIKWDFLYNTAQSKLTNVKITDTFGLDNDTPNQLLDEDSLKVYKVTYTPGGQLTKKGRELTKGTDYDISFNTEGATFVLEFEELTHGIYVEYESVFIGVKDSPISNELSVTYNDGEEQEGSNKVPQLNFNYGAFASTSAGEFVIIKTDEVTGEPMKGVEFTLKRGTRAIISGETDENGVLDFGMPFATGTYSLVEETQDGYESLKDFTFELKADGGPYEGKQIVNVTNTPTEFKDKMCPDFTITVQDVNNNPVENGKTIKLVNEKTGQVFEETTDGNGKIVKDRKDLPAGNYKVYEVDDNDEIYINDIEVKYVGEDNTECNAEVRPAVTSISGTKTWKDGGLNNEERPNITIQLLAGEVEVDSVTLTKDNVSDDDENVWEYTFENLRLLNNAGTDEIEYTVEESDVSGYKSTQDGNNFTNVRTSDEKIEIPVEKVWEGPEVEKKAVTINLLAGGEKEADLELSEANDWKGSFENLAIYDSEGEEIEYTVEEEKVDGYNTKTTGNVADGFTVTNTQKTYAIGDYVWVDYNNDGTQNESEKAAFEGVTVELYKVGEEDTPFKTTETDENGLYIFDELVAGEYKVKFRLTEEQAKKYKFTEQNADNTDATNDSDADEKGWTKVIKLDDKNEHLTEDKDYDAQTVKATEGIDPTWDAGVIELTDITVNKTWKDDKETDRPDSIKVNLKQNDTVIKEEVEIEANNDGEWTHKFTGLTKYVEEGKEYEYTVSEQDVAGYATSYDQDNYEITNTRSEEKSITINKGWLDNDDATGDRPDEIEVELFRSIEDGDKESVDIYSVKAEENWSLTIDELPAFDEDGKAYTYEIEENGVDGYTSTIDGFDITNVRTGATEVSGTKTWVDNDDKMEKRPESITVNLLANGEPIEDKSLEVTADDEWAYTFTDLDKFDENGAEITYTVDEAEVPEHYKKSFDESRLNITNTLITYAIGDYVWVDYDKDGTQNEDAKKAALEGVTVELYDTKGNKLGETTTDKNGLYIFDELLAGKYQVKFILTEEQDEKYVFTTQNAEDSKVTNDSDANVETGLTKEITLDSTNKQLTTEYTAQDFKATEGIDPTWDAGVIALVDVTITKDWKDEDDSTRPASITVDFLADEEKVREYELTAENDWTLTLEGLDKYDAAGKAIVYTVEEHAVSEYNSTVDGTDITNTQKTYAIGDYVWIDSNKDGLQDENEEIFEGVKVELFDKNNKVIETTETDKNGLYIFDELVAGDYQVKFTLTEEQAEKYKFTKQDAGEDTTVDSDADANGYTTQFTLDENNGHLTTDYKDQDFKASEGIDPTWDAGVIEKTEVTITKDWKDEDDSTRPASITVDLLADEDFVKEYDLTAANGWSLTVTELDKYDAAGKAIDYTVKEHEVSEYNSKVTGTDITNTQKTYAIGDYVWVDYNKDGMQDENEAALKGVKVELIDENGDVIAETETDENGLYIFDELVAGDYQVKFTLTEAQKEKYAFTEQNVEDATVANDSDADVETGLTKVIKLNEKNEQLTTDYDAQDFKASEGIDPTWDAGVIEFVEVTGTKTWVNDHNK